MLRMRQVISTPSEQESRSYDESDDREPQFYQKNMFVVKEDADISEAYFIDREEVPFGFEFFRKITLREVNFGEKMAGGPQLTIAGRAVVDRPFELCGACGKVKKNGKIEHATYCRYWGKEEKEKVDRGMLPVQGIHIGSHPHAASGGEFRCGPQHPFVCRGARSWSSQEVPGDPGHLLTTVMDEPVPGSDVRKRYLVLYDGVPGGTGYLKELMRDQQSLLEVFEQAYDVLKNCTCQNDPRRTAAIAACSHTGAGTTSKIRPDRQHSNC